MRSLARTARTYRRRRPRQEGAALLIVLFVLMMATSTAVYALHSTQFEQRAAGSLHQAIRTRFVAEAATVGVLELCLEHGTASCSSSNTSIAMLDTDTRDKYALPEWGADDYVYQLDPSYLKGTTFPIPTGMTSAVVVPDSALAAGGTATSFRPNFLTVVEKWQVPTTEQQQPNQTQRERFRLIVSTYGSLSTPVDTTGTSSTRAAFESISATRAFLDVR